MNYDDWLSAPYDYPDLYDGPFYVGEREPEWDEDAAGWEYEPSYERD